MATSTQDRDRFLGAAAAAVVVVIEAAWFERAARQPIWLYRLPAEGFYCVDPVAGYYVASGSVLPSTRIEVRSPLAALLARGVELRVVPTLAPIAAAVAGSTLAFSIIRPRNATPG